MKSGQGGKTKVAKGQASHTVETEKCRSEGKLGSRAESEHTHLVVNLAVHLTVAAGAALLGRERGRGWL